VQDTGKLILIVVDFFYLFLKSQANENRHTFADIMKFYRNQPQADSHIYRSVFIEYIQEKSAAEKASSDDKDQAMAKNNAAEPEVVSGRNTIYGTESRGDIIYFYNKIFVPKMQQFAMRFSTSSSQVSVFFPFASCTHDSS
jgi:retinoblastoma-like protein 1